MGPPARHQNHDSWWSFSSQAPSATGVCRPDGQEESNTEICMKAAKISPPDTRSSRISIRFNGLGFSWDVGAGRVGGWSASFVDKSNRDEGLASGHHGRPAQARYGRTGFVTLKGGSCGKSYVRVLVKTSALLCADKHRGPTARVGRACSSFSW